MIPVKISRAFDVAGKKRYKEQNKNKLDAIACGVSPNT
jgi:hypothetical protein